MKNKKTLNNMKVIMVDSERKTLNIERIKGISGDVVECTSGMLSLSDAAIYTDEWNGQIVYLYNVDLPAKVEAENLKNLRRNAALSNIFNYTSAKPFDLFAFMPWVALIVSLFF